MFKLKYCKSTSCKLLSRHRSAHLIVFTTEIFNIENKVIDPTAYDAINQKLIHLSIERIESHPHPFVLHTQSTSAQLEKNTK